MSEIIIYDCEQGSDEWFQARLGLPTGSEFSTVMAQGRKKGDPSITRTKYMLRLASEILTGQTEDTYTNAHMERGKAWEDEARGIYQITQEADLTRVGFVRNGMKGVSPDSLIGDDGGLEIKTCLGSIQIANLLRGTLPPEHKAQIQGTIWCCEREWWDLATYHPGLPLLTIRSHRDEEYIKEISDAVDRFNEELYEVVDRIRRYGQPIKDALKASLAL